MTTYLRALLEAERTGRGLHLTRHGPEPGGQLVGIEGQSQLD